MLELVFSSHIADLIKNLYTDQSATLGTTHGLTLDFRVEEGVRQGSILSPHIFKIYSEVIMINAFEGFLGTLKIGRRSIPNLRYADDIVLVGGKIGELKNIVNRVHEASSPVGQYPNISKTKDMKIIVKREISFVRNVVRKGDISKDINWDCVRKKRKR